MRRTLLCFLAVPALAAAVRLELIQPLGPSPAVFTRGWTFGVKATGPRGEDLGRAVQWSGTGTFQPATGAVSRPAFARPGRNTITLTVDVQGRRTSCSFEVEAVDPKDYARVGTPVTAPADAHGCPSCPHAVQGVIASGSPDVHIDGSPAARVGDGGRHASCCGPNTFTLVEGDPRVLIKGRQAVRIGARTRHCGGPGRVEARRSEAPQAVWKLQRKETYPAALPDTVTAYKYKLGLEDGLATASWHRPDQPSVRTSLRVSWMYIPSELKPGATVKVNFFPADAGSTPGAGGFLGCGLLLFQGEKPGGPLQLRFQSPLTYAELGKPMAAGTVQFTVPAGRPGQVLVLQVGANSAILSDTGINYLYAMGP